MTTSSDSVKEAREIAIKCVHTEQEQDICDMCVALALDSAKSERDKRIVELEEEVERLRVDPAERPMFLAKILSLEAELKEAREKIAVFTATQNMALVGLEEIITLRAEVERKDEIVRAVAFIANETRFILADSAGKKREKFYFELDTIKQANQALSKKGVGPADL